MDIDLSSFDSFVYEKMSATKLPSITTAALKDGEIVHKSAFGSKDIESAQGSAVTTLYGIGSVTKSFAALAIGKLVELGKIGDFHDPVVKYLPSFGKYKAFDNVEIHHLLTHSSGIPALGSAEVLIYNAVGVTKKWLPTSTEDDMLSFIDQVDEWVLAEPGKRFFYLNEGYNLIGDTITKASGVNYAKFIKEEIFSPLKMSRTYFAKEDVEKDGDFATPYLIKEGKPVASVIPWGAGTAGGIMSNVLDLSSYLEMYIGRGEFRGRQIVEKETIEKMERQYSKPPVTGIFSDYGYGYGLFVTNDFFGQKLVRHDGSVGVYTSSVAYLPESKLGVSVLSNAEGYNLANLSLYALMVMLGKDPEEFSPIKHDLLLQKLVGNYSSYKETVVAQVKRNGDFLILSGEDIGENIVLVPEKQDEKSATFYTLRNTGKLVVEFSFEKGRTEMIYERYRYRKNYR